MTVEIAWQKVGTFFCALNFCLMRASFLSGITYLQEFVLRNMRASPLEKPFLTPARWQLFKCVRWNVSVGLKCLRTSRTLFSRIVLLYRLLCPRNKLASRVISIGSLNEKFYYIPCSLQCREILLCDRLGLSTDRDLGRVKKWFQERGWPLACPSSVYLWVALWKKKQTNKQTKKAALRNMFLVHEYNHKIPFQCFIAINSNTDPNLTTTFNFVTSSLLLMGHVSFPIPLGFQSQVKD